MKVNSLFILFIYFVGTSFTISVSPNLQPMTTAMIPEFLNRSKREQPTDTPLYCDRFSIPIPSNNTFFSPLDPRSAENVYQRDANCFFVLEAPPGHIIKLDFRNKFNIESSSNGCDFDYLEIRDGQYGFSKLLGKFCGTEFPPMIFSSERYLWLRFKSDENIEYEGFQAVFEFVQRPTASYLEEAKCVFDRNGTEGFINRTDIDPEIVDTITMHSLDLDCLWTIDVNPGWKILLVFLQFELDKKNDCNSNFVDIFDAVTDLNNRTKNFCGVLAETVVSRTNRLYVRFFAEKQAINSKFSILYTAFRSKENKGEECKFDEYDCDDDTCIAAELECNSNNNCKFSKDEGDCGGEVQDKLDHLIIIIVVFSLILGGMTTAFLINCIRKLIRDQKIIREHIRQSKESKLDEAGRISLKLSRDNINKLTNARKPISQQRSIHVLDDDSNKYYGDMVPNMPVGFREDIKISNDFRNKEIKEIIDSAYTKMGQKNSEEETMVDMACQTRESLFGPIVKNKQTQLSTKLSQPNDETIRFSTFGYDTNNSNNSHQHHHSHLHHHHHKHHQQQSATGGSLPHQPSDSSGDINQSLTASNTKLSTNRDKINKTIATTTIEMEDFGHSPEEPLKAQQPPPPLPYHYQRSDNNRNRGVGGGGGGVFDSNKKSNVKLEESRAYVDIRNSAPDVIIMTSH